jgi:cell division protein FtsI (penicillin-binding protein 3)
MLVVLLLGFTGIFARLVLLQVKDASALQALARDQRLRDVPLPAARGSILDRNGDELAMSLPAKGVFADPQLVKNPQAEAGALAQTLNLKYTDVYRALTGSGRFGFIARGVDLPAARAVQELQLPGVGIANETRRFYPAGPLAPQVVGVVGVDGTGLAGLELQYQSLLAGRAGREVIEEDPGGIVIPQGTTVDLPPVPGDDLILTLDRQIQFRAQQALENAVKANRAKGGTVIVMDPGTGDILAMATYPWFDPNNLAAANADNLRNRAVTDAYEPGSVNKVITASAALEEGVLNLNQKLTVSYSLKMYTKTFTDAHSHPTEKMTLGDIIAYSSNIGAIEVAGLLGQSRFAPYLYKFGLDRSTGLSFPGESKGILPPPTRWSGTSMGTIPIGQGIAVTPLQMACVYATVANGGTWVEPRLVRSTVGPDGTVVPAPPGEERRVVSTETAAEVRGLLAYAVDVGTGTQAQIPGYWVGGKTGTARKILANGTGYSDKYIASFIGFAPAARPALVVAAILDEPVTVYGGIAAAPLFQEVMRFSLLRLRIAPAAKLPIPPHAVAAG